MKRIFLIIFSFAFMAVVSAQDSLTVKQFGYLSYNAVLKAMPDYAEAQKSLSELKGSYAKELIRSEEVFSKQFAEYVDGQKSFPENILLKRQKELQQLMEQGLKFKQETQQLLEKAEAELMQPVHQKLKDALAVIGKAKNYHYILNTDTGSYPYVNTEIGEDITSEVISELSK